MRRPFQSVREHPRPCGEDLRALELMSARPETPPPVRGRLNGSMVGDSSQRNTPARAGKTLGHELLSRAQKKHPRPCGEDAGQRHASSRGAETPPPVRGRPSAAHLASPGLGNTPARAGKTSMQSLQPEIVRKHPRPCGEDLPSRIRRHASSETPPPVRGRRCHRGGVGNEFRNTPARAGKTGRKSDWTATWRKHPRPCGED